MIQTQHAGKLYGEGMKGYVEDCNCIKDDKKTFCQYLKKHRAQIKEISLYSSTSRSFKLDIDEEIDKIIGILNDKQGLVVKTFKGSHPKDGFIAEIKGFLKILSILKNKDYHTVHEGFVLKNEPIYGLCISYTNKTNSYHTFTEGCSTPIDKMKFKSQEQFDIFVKHIYDALTAIHEQGYYHNDIKPDNMIYCAKDERFKLIDWELSSKMPAEPRPFYSGGTTLYNHPLKFYLGGLPAIICKQLIQYSVVILGKHKWVRKLKVFKTLKFLNSMSLDWILEKENTKSKVAIHRKYYPHFDNYAFAQSVLYLAEKHGMIAPSDLIADLMGPFLPKP